jgi:hypothetical protein
MTKGDDMKEDIEALNFGIKQLHISLNSRCLQLFNLTANWLIHHHFYLRCKFVMWAEEYSEGRGDVRWEQIAEHGNVAVHDFLEWRVLFFE